MGLSSKNENKQNTLIQEVVKETVTNKNRQGISMTTLLLAVVVVFLLTTIVVGIGVYYFFIVKNNIQQTKKYSKYQSSVVYNEKTNLEGDNNLNSVDSPILNNIQNNVQTQDSDSISFAGTEVIVKGDIEWKVPKNLGDLEFTSRKVYEGCVGRSVPRVADKYKCDIASDKYAYSTGVSYYEVGVVKGQGDYANQKVLVIKLPTPNNYIL